MQEQVEPGAGKPQRPLRAPVTQQAAGSARAAVTSSLQLKSQTAAQQLC
jgi:hypothetical protein